MMPRRVIALASGPRRGHPLPWAMAGVFALGLVSGIGVGAVTGAATGTCLIPMVGTAFGAFYGVFVGAAASVICTPIVVVVLLVRHRRVMGPHAPLPDLARLFAVIVPLPIVAGLRVVFEFAGGPVWVTLWGLGAVLAGATVLVLSMRVAARVLSAAWCRPFGWIRAAPVWIVTGARTD